MRLVLCLVVALALVAWVFEQTDVPDRPPEAGTTLEDVLGSGAAGAGFARAEAPRRFVFPRDHAAHRAYRSEWWYFTGNLADARGRHFGYQLTLFRFGLAPTVPASASSFRTGDVYMGHFAVTDTDRAAFASYERFGRGGAGVAGAVYSTEAGPEVAVWLDDWRIEFDRGTWRLTARHGPHQLDLALAPEKPATLQGDAGLSRKSSEAGNASYYYSLTRLASRGTLTTGEGTFEVSGSSWLDREWSTSALSRDQIGWDWFALQLEDGSDLMFYRIRNRDGSADPVSAGTIVPADGVAEPLALEDVRLRPGRTWRSPESGAVYPVAWRLEVPGRDLDLVLKPRLPDQEHTGAFPYWEGAVMVTGSAAGRPIAGSGYIEMTGY